MEELNYCTTNPLRSLDIVTGEADMKGLGEVVRLPGLLPCGLLERMLQLLPTVEPSQQSISPVNLPLSSRQIEIISEQIKIS